MKDISIDTYDLVLAVALWGGFTTGQWIPALVLFSLLIIAVRKGY